MHKKKQSPLLRSLRNPNAFKKKSSKILKSLSPASNFSLQSPQKQKQSSDFATTKITVERSRIISSEYALNYKQPPQHSFLSKQTQSQNKKQKQSFKNAKILLNSAFDVGSRGKVWSMGKMAQMKRINRNLSVSGSEWKKKRESQLTNQESGKRIFDSSRKKRYSMFGKSNENTNTDENIKKLQILKDKNKNMFMNTLSQIQRKEDQLQEEREKFMMVKEIYLQQIKKLTKSLLSNKNQKYKLPISDSQTKTRVKGKQPQMSVLEDYHLKGYNQPRKRIQTQ